MNGGFQENFFHESGVHFQFIRYCSSVVNSVVVLYKQICRMNWPINNENSLFNYSLYLHFG